MRWNEQLIAERRRKGLTQEELADKAGLTGRTIQRIESGGSVPRMFTLKALARALDLPADHFISLVAGPLHQPADSPLPSPPDDAHPFPGNEPQLPADNHNLHLHNLHLYNLHLLNLSACSFLLLPFLNFILPAYLLKKYKPVSHSFLVMARRIIRQQVLWTICLHGFLALILVINLVSASNGWPLPPISYLLPLVILYGFNVLLILANARQIRKSSRPGA